MQPPLNRSIQPPEVTLPHTLALTCLLPSWSPASRGRDCGHCPWWRYRRHRWKTVSPRSPGCTSRAGNAGCTPARQTSHAARDDWRRAPSPWLARRARRCGGRHLLTPCDAMQARKRAADTQIIQITSQRTHVSYNR